MIEDFQDDESRSARKREAEGLQELGERLITLSAQRLEQVPLPDNLAEAIAQARRIKDRGAARRQRQYIGRLMRQVDPEPIRAALARFDAEDTGRTRAHHDAEHWRDRLIAEGETAMGELIAHYPMANRARLASLVNATQEERAQARPPRAARELFRHLRDLLATAAD